MINFVELVIGLFIAIAVAILIILITGIIYNRDGYVSVIEKKHEFYKIEMRKFSWYMPLMFKKAAYYPIIKGTVRVNKKKVVYQVVDVMKLYKTGRKVKNILADEKNLERSLEKDYGIKLIK